MQSLPLTQASAKHADAMGFGLREGKNFSVSFLNDAHPKGASLTYSHASSSDWIAMESAGRGQGALSPHDIGEVSAAVVGKASRTESNLGSQDAAERLEKEGSSSLSACDLGWKLVHAGAVEDGLRFLQLATAQDAGNIDAFIKLARAHVMQGNFREADQALCTVSEHLPQTAPMEMLRAELSNSQGRFRDAFRRYSKVIALEPEYGDAMRRITEIQQSYVPSWHFPMMADDIRNQAYANAIRNAILPSDRVLDIGCGSGLTSLLSVQAGAKEVVAMECHPMMASIAQKNFAKNGVDHCVELIRERSFQVKDNFDRCDVAVFEIFDTLAIGEDLLRSVQHAKAFLLKPQARLLPARFRVVVAPVSAPALRSYVRADSVLGFDLSALNESAPLQPAMVRLWDFEYRFLCQPAPLLEFDLQSDFSLLGERALSLPITEEGVMDGFALWFEADFGEGTVLSTAPDQPKTAWGQGFEALEAPRSVAPGTVLSLLGSYARHHLWVELLP